MLQERLRSLDLFQVHVKGISHHKFLLTFPEKEDIYSYSEIHLQKSSKQSGRFQNNLHSDSSQPAYPFTSNNPLTDNNTTTGSIAFEGMHISINIQDPKTTEINEMETLVETDGIWNIRDSNKSPISSLSSGLNNPLVDQAYNIVTLGSDKLENSTESSKLVLAPKIARLSIGKKM